MMMLSQRKLKLIALYSGVSFMRRRKFSFERHPERCRSGNFAASTRASRTIIQPRRLYRWFDPKVLRD